MKSNNSNPSFTIAPIADILTAVSIVVVLILASSISVIVAIVASEKSGHFEITSLTFTSFPDHSTCRSIQDTYYSRADNTSCCGHDNRPDHEYSTGPRVHIRCHTVDFYNSNNRRNI